VSFLDASGEVVVGKSESAAIKQWLLLDPCDLCVCLAYPWESNRLKVMQIGSNQT